MWLVVGFSISVVRLVYILSCPYSTGVPKPVGTGLTSVPTFGTTMTSRPWFKCMSGLWLVLFSLRASADLFVGSWSWNPFRSLIRVRVSCSSRF